MESAPLLQGHLTNSMGKAARMQQLFGSRTTLVLQRSSLFSLDGSKRQQRRKAATAVRGNTRQQQQNGATAG